MLFQETKNAHVSALVELGHVELKARALLALPFDAPSLAVPSSGDLGLGTFLNGPLDTGGSIGLGTHKTRRLTTIIETGGHAHLLILPFVAVLAEVSLVALVIQAYRWKREAVPDPQDLLAL